MRIRSNSYIRFISIMQAAQREWTLHSRGYKVNREKINIVMEAFDAGRRSLLSSSTFVIFGFERFRKLKKVRIQNLAGGGCQGLIASL